MLLEIKETHTYFGKSHILHNVSMAVEKGEIVALVGRNGVGKSTTLKSIIGLAPSTKGSIRFKGRDIAGWRPHKICRLGVGYVPEERRIFPKLTVRQNLLVGMKSKQEVTKSWTIDRVYSFFPTLGQRDRQKGGNLSGGEQQMLTIGRTLMGNPEILLVDEVLAVGDFAFQQKCLGKMQHVAAEGRTVLFVSHNMAAIRNLCHRAICLERGEQVLDGRADKVVSQYLEADRKTVP